MRRLRMLGLANLASEGKKNERKEVSTVRSAQYIQPSDQTESTPNS
jgi:hypothetical protein